MQLNFLAYPQLFEFLWFIQIRFGNPNDDVEYINSGPYWQAPVSAILSFGGITGFTPPPQPGQAGTKKELACPGNYKFQITNYKLQTNRCPADKF